MEQDIETAVKRGRAYWFVDGFAELLAGILFVVLGGATIVRGMAGLDIFLGQFASTAVDIGILKAVGLLAAVLIFWWLKDRFTYPRTGFVGGYRVPPAALLAFLRNVLLIVVLPVLGLVAVFIFFPPARGLLGSIPAWLPAAIGVFLGIVCFISGEWMGLRRFRIMGILILLAGIAIGVWQLLTGFPTLPADALQANFLEPLAESLSGPLDEILSRAFTGIGLLTLTAGILFVLSGLVTFIRYRKENPVPYREGA
jgi:hypothetical protein